MLKLPHLYYLTISAGITTNGENHIIVEDKKIKSGQANSYAFSKIFDHMVPQQVVFEKTGLPMVKELLDGHDRFVSIYIKAMAHNCIYVVFVINVLTNRVTKRYISVKNKSTFYAEPLKACYSHTVQQILAKLSLCLERPAKKACSHDPSMLSSTAYKISNKRLCFVLVTITVSSACRH